jgi:PadR family transcriptional regulator, regulatory protein PadR
MCSHHASETLRPVVAQFGVPCRTRPPKTEFTQSRQAAKFRKEIPLTTSFLHQEARPLPQAVLTPLLPFSPSSLHLFTFLLLTNRRLYILLLASNRRHMEKNKNDLLPGTLNLMILKTLDTLGTLHGYGVARRIEQISGNLLQLNQGTIYPALLQLEQMGWIRSKWGISENNRRARYYSITPAGRKKLVKETENWQRTSDIMIRFLEPAKEKL